MKNLLYLLFLLIGTIGTSQDFTLEPIPVFVEGLATNQPLIAFADLTNHTDSSQVVIWQRLSENIPEGWDSGVCTSLGCFLSDVADGDFPMIPLESLNIDVQFDTYGIPGTGRVEVKIFLEKDSTDFVIGIYEANAVAVATKEVEQSPKLVIQPNPCLDYCYIAKYEEVSSFIIYNMLGVSVRQGLMIGTEIFAGDLEKGLYYICFKMKEKEEVKTVSFVKG